jgi:hypothetical protein
VAGLLLMPAFVAAQNTAQGDIMIGVSTSDIFSYAYREEAPGGDFDGPNATPLDTINISLASFAGYFIADGWEIGPEVFFEFARENEQGTVDMATDLAVGAQVGYFSPNAEGFVPYGRLNVSFISTTFEFANNDRGENGFSVTPRAGFAYFFGDRVGLNLNAYFNYLRAIDIDPDNDFEAQEFDVGLEIGLVLAISRLP